MLKFSIIIPVYNVFSYLERSVKSAISQTYSEIEILLIDDGSTDGSEDLCESLAREDSRIYVYHKKNGGLSDARNFGLEMATGKYIIFLDSDDYINIDLCQKLAQYMLYLKDQPDIITIRAAKVVGTKVTGYIRYSQLDKTVVSGKEFLKREFKHGCMNMTGCLSICRKEFLNKNHFRFLVGILHEDEELMPRMFLRAKSVASSDILGYYYVQRQGSITQSESLERNAKDINNITNQLERRYRGISDKELREYLLDSLVTKRLNILQQGRLIGKQYEHLYDRDFLKRNAKSKKNLWKVQLFLISPHLYYEINNMLKKLIGGK